MNVSSLLLLLVFGLCDRPAGAKKQDAVMSPEQHAARLRGLWKLHMRDSPLKGTGEPAPDRFFQRLHRLFTDTNVFLFVSPV